MIALIDSTSSSLTVSWPAVSGAIRYRLEYRRAVCSDDAAVSFDTLSESLTTTQARKKNLDDEDGAGFYFRVGAISADDDTVKSWVTHTDPFQLLSKKDENSRMAPPKVSPSGSNQSVLVTWSKYTQEIKGFELQMRENNGGIPWETIAPCLTGTEVRKKNLSSKLGYQFRVRPVQESPSDTPFSPPSDSIVALGLSEGMKRMFSGLENGRLLQNPSAKPLALADALGGKEFVLLYASAHWCGPCRNFSPKLSKWYQSLPTKNVEVVFLSCDHDEQGFKSYYSSMPWLAVPFDDDARENLLGVIRVTGIPRLVVLDGRTGRIIEDNAVGKSFDMNRWRKLAAGNK